MASIAIDLFRYKGPEEPIRPRGLCQSAEEYIEGREDFLYGFPYRHDAYPDWRRQNSYHCGWSHEKFEAGE